MGDRGRERERMGWLGWLKHIVTAVNVILTMCILGPGRLPANAYSLSPGSWARIAQSKRITTVSRLHW